MSNMFVIEEAKATQAKAKIALVGPAGCGKTYTSLITGHELGDRILVIDTENKTSAKYAKVLSFKYDVMGLPNYSLQTYIDGLNFAADKGYDVVIVDSLPHAWAGEGGALEQAETAGRAKYGGNKFAGWSDVTPLQNRLVNTILAYPAHLIATMRMKIEYALVTDERGKQAPKKLGLGIVQRDSFEYEFDIIAQLDVDHTLMITKTRCFELDGFVAHKPDGTLGKTIKNWLSDGDPVKSFATLDELLFELHKDFGLAESDAKEKLRQLGFTGWPKNGEARRKSIEMYQAVKADLVGNVG